MAKRGNTEQVVLSIVVSAEQLGLLRKLAFPCSEEVLASARPAAEGPAGEGIELTGSWRDFDSLVGWVAGEANHARGPRKAELLHDLADQLENVLASAR